ncbi:hypothetical protein K490DRAFT_42910 [Saccharata proteae CBS 121410]|uniref:HNH domain-containing protein n=1 Tax=Saccharata proteae CBS 121410 TaxID=1314787 RepID=A0A9P4LWM6_9PEZI|nr:hypothetical protein K490DRAFT_42910 [Saccharata proteae CBS 121410]
MTFIPEDELSNFSTFRDCLSEPVIQSLATAPKPTRRRKQGRKNAIKPVEPVEAPAGNDAEELGEFIDYLAFEIFTSLPPDLRTISYTAVQHSPSLETTYANPLPTSTLSSLLAPLPTSTTDSLLSYALIPNPSYLSSFLSPILASYISATTTPPPVWANTRTSECELCDRDWVPLTYHHLIPRSVAQKAVKRGWCEEWETGRVAWLCRACHSFVHGIAGNEELAREWASVESLLGRDDVKKWIGWVGRVRWRKT